MKYNEIRFIEKEEEYFIIINSVMLPFRYYHTVGGLYIFDDKGMFIRNWGKGNKITKAFQEFEPTIKTKRIMYVHAIRNPADVIVRSETLKREFAKMMLKIETVVHDTKIVDVRKEYNIISDFILIYLSNEFGEVEKIVKRHPNLQAGGYE